MSRSTTLRTLAVAAILVVSGIARMPVEQAITRDLQEQGMLREPLDIETRQKVGQGFWAVSLGGLRTLVATILNLRAYSYFENHKWDQVADTYDTIVELAPNTTYYWDSGSWHMAYNAASFQQIHSELPDLRRRADWRHWVQKGTLFLEEGCRQNPDDWKLWSLLGFLYADPNKLIDYEKAANAYHKAAITGNSLPYVRRSELYCLSRVPGREKEAIDLLRKLQEEEVGETPTFRCLRLALELWENPQLDSMALALEIFGSEERAYEQLSSFYIDPRSGYPMNGLPELLRKMEQNLQVPEEQSAFKARENLEQNPPDPWQR